MAGFPTQTSFAGHPSAPVVLNHTATSDMAPWVNEPGAYLVADNSFHQQSLLTKIDPLLPTDAAEGDIWTAVLEAAVFKLVRSIAGFGEADC